MRNGLRLRFFGAVLFAALAPCLASTLYANGWPKTLVRTAEAAVYERPDAASPVRLTLKFGAVVGVRREDGGWCDVSAASGAGGRTIDGWMRAADLVRAPGMARFWAGDFQDAMLALESDVRGTEDPVIAAWLQFYLGYSQRVSGQLDLARATFGAIAHRRPPTRFAADAFVAAAKVASVQGDLPGALAAYEGMLAAFPDRRAAPHRFDPAVDPYPMARDLDSEVTMGDPSIPNRVRALQRLIETQAAAARAITDAGATPIQVATAWHGLGQAWEDKNRVDPSRTHLGGMIIDNSDARRCYKTAVDAAPGSPPAGHAAWRLIALSEPYEWEGNWQSQAAWSFESYATFLADYPRHELAPEARFNIAVATWVKAGYPEVYGDLFVPGGWDMWKSRLVFLDQWFDTKRIGGGVGEPATPQPEQAARAQQMFRDIVATSPTAKSASMAQYYVAVIFDYCLSRPDEALPEYETFIREYPKADPFVEKARNRLAAIRSGRG